MKTTQEIRVSTGTHCCKRNAKWFSEEEINKVLDEQLPSSFKVPIRRALFGDKK